MDHRHVAGSDLNAALAAIETEFRSAADRTDSAVAQQLFGVCATSFTAQIRSYMAPLPDEEYDALIVVADENKATTVEAFDDDELVDTATHDRVRALRAQVRERAATIRELRESTIRRPAEIVERHFQLMQTNTERVLPTVDQDRLLQGHQEDIDALKTNVDRVTSLLNQTQSNIPAQVKFLQDTLSAVEKGLSDGGSRIDDAIKNRFDTVADHTAEEYKTMSYHEITEEILSRGLK